jgi:hypothetical protein
MIKQRFLFQDDGDKLQHKSNMASDLDQFLPQRLVDFMEKAKVKVQ